ncbi:helix-turn-helix domain-containing protein [Hahella sp. CR1]|uniref:GlxA family transcriptional regulator n=1 Tax=Hahella sp. CR1 TaxID=2992807 RepID=UPI0024425BEA|nr:helix-turn-helix domain-containing protein [Hahella sp. CR1]MDG9669527.1 helix-turn-helix domain-containing protein [Hahella sp. CR1]
MTANKGFMTKQQSLHKIALLVFDGVAIGDVSVPISLFPYAVNRAGSPIYTVGICSSTERLQTGFLTIAAPNDLSWALSADTLIVPGVDDLETAIPSELIDIIQKAWVKGVRIVSLCTGAFILAQAGILDGAKATTHWKATNEFVKRFKKIKFVPDVLYVDNGQILTSAGATAAFDLCLHLIREDCGNEVAATIADLAMVPMERAGIQPQLSHSSLLSENDPITKILAWIEENIERSFSLNDISNKFNLSTRTLTRLFIGSVGLPPAKWITMARIRKAKSLLENTNLSIDIIAEAVGYSSAEVFRENFRKASKFSPSTYRRIYHRDIWSE